MPSNFHLCRSVTFLALLLAWAPGCASRRGASPDLTELSSRRTELERSLPNVPGEEHLQQVSRVNPPSPCEPSRSKERSISYSGAHAVFTSSDALSGSSTIHLSRIGGREDRVLVQNGGLNESPVFLPGAGDRVMFSSNFADPTRINFDLWIVNTDGTDLERITFHPGFDGMPRFSSDGRHLTFCSNRNDPRGEKSLFEAEWIP